MSRKAKASTRMSTELKAVELVEPAGQVVTAIVPAKAEPSLMTILAKAIEMGSDVETLGKLMDLVERREKAEAKKAFDEALAAFKENPPEIAKNKPVQYETSKGTVKYKHATLDRVTVAIAKGLAKVGMSATWTTGQKDGKIVVTCKLRHKLGHEEPTTLEAPPDDTGSKNAVQQIASTVTYLERYTLLAATGLATADDADGITFGDIEAAVDDIRSAATLEELQERFNKAYKKGFASKNQSAMAICIEAKDQRKAELSGKIVPKSQIAPEDPGATEKATARLQEFESICAQKGLNQANRHMFLAQHATMDEAIAAAKKLPDAAQAGASEVTETPASEAPPARKREKRGKAPEPASTPAPAGQPKPREPEWGF